MAEKQKGGSERMLADLAAMRLRMHDLFPEAKERLRQLDAHIGTVAMVIEHIHDEADRGSAEGA